MSTIVLDAESRNDLGKGASRRLRRLENKIPAVLYGGDKKPKSIHLLQNKVIKALENESIYSSVFNLNIDGKVEHVILKDLQRHPYKPIIMHMDLQRVTAKEVLTKFIPLHFTNEDVSKGVKAGGIVSHTMNQVEVRCQVKDLPEFIEVDMSDVQLNDVVHLSSLKLPKGVHLVIDAQDQSHDLPVVSIHSPKVSTADEETATPVTEVIGKEEAQDDASAE
ncbi:MAG: 50S ribosomal protein L25/general stress protein Ctc [Tatlockia sp.]|jgi:large subunit ribosomal protein L25